jgi:hypothetical protein
MFGLTSAIAPIILACRSTSFGGGCRLPVCNHPTDGDLQARITGSIAEVMPDILRRTWEKFITDWIFVVL